MFHVAVRSSLLVVFLLSLSSSAWAGEILWATVQHHCASYSLLHKIGQPGSTHHLEALPQEFKVEHVAGGVAGFSGDNILFSYDHSIIGHDYDGAIKLEGRIQIEEAHDFDLSSPLSSPLEEPTHLIRGFLKYSLYENGAMTDCGVFEIGEKQWGDSFFSGAEFNGETGSLYIRASEIWDYHNTGYKRGMDLVVSLKKHTVPEPTSLALAVLGLGGLAAASTLRRRRARTAAR